MILSNIITSIIETIISNAGYFFPEGNVVMVELLPVTLCVVIEVVGAKT